MEERLLGKEEVTGPSPVSGSLRVWPMGQASGLQPEPSEFESRRPLYRPGSLGRSMVCKTVRAGPIPARASMPL